MLFELLEPVADANSAGSHVPRDRGDRFTIRRQQHYPGSSVKSGSNRLKLVSFFTRKSKLHTESIGKELQLSVSKLMARCSRIHPLNHDPVERAGTVAGWLAGTLAAWRANASRKCAGGSGDRTPATGYFFFIASWIWLKTS